MLEALLGLGKALLLTIAAEAPVAWLLGLRTWRAQAVLLLVNVITNPVLNLILVALAATGTYSVRSPFDPVLAALECLVVAAEALLLKVTLGFPTGRAFLVSFAANAASYLAGALVLW